MPTPILDAIGVTATDMRASIAFYQALGFAFPALGGDDQHIEAVTAPGAVRLMIDSAELATSLIGAPPRPSNASAFALLYDNPAAVDETVRAAEKAGAKVETAPWDAFWGQRYATISDLDGYKIDLFAYLPK